MFVASAYEKLALPDGYRRSIVMLVEKASKGYVPFSTDKNKGHGKRNSPRRTGGYLLREIPFAFASRSSCEQGAVFHRHQRSPFTGNVNSISILAVKFQ